MTLSSDADHNFNVLPRAISLLGIGLAGGGLLAAMGNALVAAIQRSVLPFNEADSRQVSTFHVLRALEFFLPLGLLSAMLIVAFVSLARRLQVPRSIERRWQREITGGSLALVLLAALVICGAELREQAIYGLTGESAAAGWLVALGISTILLAIVVCAIVVIKDPCFRPSWAGLGILVALSLLVSPLPLLANRGMPPGGFSSWADNGFMTTAFVGVPGVAASYTSVSCPTSSRCIAVGIGSGDTPVVATGRPGGKWRAVTSTVSANDTYDFVLKVQCETSDSCVAVGDELFASLDGGLNWTTLRLPDDDYPVTASCPSLGRCVVVGQSTSRGSTPKASVFVLDRRESRWRNARLPRGDWRFSTLSCDDTGDECLMIGQADPQSQSSPELLVSTDGGSSWQTVPIPAGMPPCRPRP